MKIVTLRLEIVSNISDYEIILNIPRENVRFRISARNDKKYLCISDIDEINIKFSKSFRFVKYDLTRYSVWIQIT